MRTNYFLITLFVAFFIGKTNAQISFTEIAGTAFPPLKEGEAHFADFDNDNDLDLIISGGGQSDFTMLNTPTTIIYNNDGLGNFTEQAGLSITPLTKSSISVGDIDNDSDLDIFINGMDDSFNYISQVYSNDGSGNFSLTSNTITGFIQGDSEFGDIDGDGDLDLIVSGYTGSAYNTSLYVNDGSGNFSLLSGTPFSGTNYASVKFLDIDSDTDLDVVISGTNGSTTFTQLYTNNGTGTYTLVNGTPFRGSQLGSIDAADVDNDNDLDILITGYDGSTQFTELYINDGSGNYTLKTGTSFRGVYNSSVQFADFNVDGAPDFIISGYNSVTFSRYTLLYLNDGSGSFTEMPSTPFPGNQNFRSRAADIDGDGDPDFYLSGSSNGSRNPDNAILYKNNFDAAPVITSVTVPPNATYTAGQNLDFTVNFNENVTVDTASGSPQIAIIIGTTARQAVYQSGSGTGALVFRYTVQVGDVDTDGIAVSTLAANGGTLRDTAGNDADLTLNNVGVTTSVLVVAPATLTVTGLTATDKPYDGSTVASVTGTAVLSSNVQPGDDVILTGTPVYTFINKNVGTGITINTTGYALTGADAGKYTLTQPVFSADITARPITITAQTQSKIYGSALTLDNTAFTVTDLDDDSLLPNGEVIDAVSLSSASGVVASTAVAATYPNELVILSQTGSNGFNASNYTITYVAGDFVINYRPITITAQAQSKIYGTTSTLDNTAFTVTDLDGDSVLPNGEVIDVVSLSSASGMDASTMASVNTYMDDLVISSPTGSNGFNAENYSLTYVADDFEITPRAITITAQTQSKIYGTTLTLDNTAFTVTDLDGDSVLPNGEVIDAVSLSSATGVDASTTAAVGTYADELMISSPTGSNGFSVDNYSLTYVAGDLVVTPAVQIGLVFADNSFTYDGSVKSLVVTGQAADATVTYTNNDQIDAGTYAVTATVTRPNYTTAVLNATLTINKAEAIITADATQTFTYDGTVKTISASLNHTETALTYTPQQGYTDAGSYPITISAVETANYLAASENVSLVIEPATQTGLVFADNSFTYDGTVKSLVVTGQAADATVIYENNGKTNEGSYTVKATVTRPDFEDAVLEATLVINPRPITITAVEQSKIYGSTLTPDNTAFTVTDLDGDSVLPNGETIDAVSIASATGVDASTTTDVGTYVDELVISSQTGSAGFDASNYDISYTDGDLVVNTRAITISAQEQSKVYGNTLMLDNTAFAVTDLDGNSVLPNGESIDEVSVESATGVDASTTADVGTYTNELVISSQTGSAGFDASNYDISYIDGDLVVNPATQTELVFADNSFTYDATEKSLAVTGLAMDATVSYANNDKINVGIYEVTATVTRPNYNTALLEATLTITKAEAVITADAVQIYTYDGNLKNVTASLNHNKITLVYTPQQGYTNAGTYPVTVTAIETDNYLSASKEVTLVIENAEITGVTFIDETFSYDGTSKTIEVSGLPEGASVSYENNDQTAAGTYEVTATVSQENYNDKILTAGLVIEKAEAVITADALQTFTYDGTVKNVAATLNHSETALTYSPAQGYTDAGTYGVTIVSAETDNYLSASKEVTLVIENAEITGVTFEDDTFIYDGTSKTIEVNGLPEGAEVSYENNDQTAAGTYEVTAIVSQENYNDKILTAFLVIEKAEATITADAIQTFTYDGTVRNVGASLNHSETALTYTPAQGYTDAGTYGVTVVSAETDNYLSASKEVTLVIENAEITGVTFEDGTFTYDSTLKTIEVSGLPEGASVSYENNGKTNAGNYKVTATIRQGNYNELELTANMLIEKASQSITFNELEDLYQRVDEYLQLDATSSSGLPVLYSYTYETENPAATVDPQGFVSILNRGQITITATQEGNQNYEAATPVVRTLTIIGSEARLNTAVINGTTYSNPSDEIYYLIDCGSSENEVRIELEQNGGSSIDRSNSFTINTPAPGIYREVVTVTSEDGNLTRSYKITVEKNFNFEDIVVQKFNNVLLVNNNPQTNGGYRFISYRWYKDGSVIGNGQYYSAGNNADDQLDANSSYYVVMETGDGEFLRTCTSAIQLRSSLNVSLAPNPINSGGTMELLADFPKDELETMNLSIINLNGMLIKQMKSNSKSTSITLPYNLEMGVYLLKIETKNIRKSVKFIIK